MRLPDFHSELGEEFIPLCKIKGIVRIKNIVVLFYLHFEHPSLVLNFKKLPWKLVHIECVFCGEIVGGKDLLKNIYNIDHSQRAGLMMVLKSAEGKGGHQKGEDLRALCLALEYCHRLS